MYFIRKIAFIQVVAIILLHSLVPHKHQGEMTFEEHFKVHENADDVIDYLSLAFHQNSNSSLENYILTEQNLKNNYLDNHFLKRECFTKNELIFTNVSLYFKVPFQKLSNTLLVQLNGLRAPPNYEYYS